MYLSVYYVEPWLQVTLSEGKNREIRRVFEHFGHPVLRVIRVNYGPYNLGKLCMYIYSSYIIQLFIYLI